MQEIYPLLSNIRQTNTGYPARRLRGWVGVVPVPVRSGFRGGRPDRSRRIRQLARKPENNKIDTMLLIGN